MHNRAMYGSKKKWSTSIAILGLFVSATALAAYEHPENTWQPGAEQKVVELAPGYVSTTQTSKSTQPRILAASTADTKGWGLAPNLQYGLTDSWAVAFGSSYFNTTVEGSTAGSTAVTKDKRVGFSDLHFSLKSFHEMTPNALVLYFGLTTYFSPTKARASNYFSGGHSFMPYAALAFTEKEFKFGPKLSFLFNLKKTTEVNDRSTSDSGFYDLTEKGAHDASLGAFAEYWAKDWLLGFEANYSMITSNDVESSYVADQVPTTESYTLEGYNTLSLRAYSRIKLMDTLDLIPEFAYLTRLSDSYLDSDVSLTQGAAAARKVKNKVTLEQSGWSLAFNFRWFL